MDIITPKMVEEAYKAISKDGTQRAKQENYFELLDSENGFGCCGLAALYLQNAGGTLDNGPSFGLAGKVSNEVLDDIEQLDSSEEEHILKALMSVYGVSEDYLIGFVQGYDDIPQERAESLSRRRARSKGASAEVQHKRFQDGMNGYRDGRAASIIIFEGLKA